jgi:hypothetical protein
MHRDTIRHTTNEAPFNSVIQASTMPGMSNVTALRGNRLKCSIEGRDISMNLQFTNVMKKSLQQNKVYLPLVPYCTNQRNKRICSFLSSPTDCIWTHLPQHTDKTAPPWNLNIIIRIKHKQHLRIYEDMNEYTQPQILQHRVSTYSRSYLKGINHTMKIRARNKQNIHDPQLCFIKIGGFSFT